MVIKKYGKLFENLKPVEPPAGLLERIILSIEREKDFNKKKRFFLVFSFLLFFSIFTLPFSWRILVEEVRKAGTFYFFSTVFANFGLIFTLWQDFSLVILESLPLGAMVVFLLNLSFLFFALRWFLFKKQLLFHLFDPQIKYGRSIR